jgi:hypothetical protein
MLSSRANPVSDIRIFGRTYIGQMDEVAFEVSFVLERLEHTVDRYALVSIVQGDDAPIVYKTAYFVDEPFIRKRWMERRRKLEESHPGLALADNPLRVALKASVSDSPQPRVVTKYLPILHLYLAVGEESAVVVDSSILPQGLSLSRQDPVR